MHSIMIKDYMVRYPYIVSPELSIKDASEYMTEMKIRHLPVVIGERLKGIISERDVRAALATEKSDTLCVADIMKSDVYIAHPQESLGDVVNDMATEKVGSAIVVDDSHQVLGIFTTTDALKILGERMTDFEEKLMSEDLRDRYEDDYLWAT